jgi:hypothetical protein
LKYSTITCFAIFQILLVEIFFEKMFSLCVFETASLFQIIIMFFDIFLCVLTNLALVFGVRILIN